MSLFNFNESYEDLMMAGEYGDPAECPICGNHTTTTDIIFHKMCEECWDEQELNEEFDDFDDFDDEFYEDVE